MSPTRELAMQIEQEAFKFTTACNLPSAAIYGGVSRSEQLFKLRGGIEILVATPGRLLDFLEYKQTNLNRCTYLVLDEADRMLDMGFEKDMIRIIDMIPAKDRQTLMFSATWPKEIQKLANRFCAINPVHIKIGDQHGHDGFTVNENIQ